MNCLPVAIHISTKNVPNYRPPRKDGLLAIGYQKQCTLCGRRPQSPRHQLARLHHTRIHIPYEHQQTLLDMLLTTHIEQIITTPTRQNNIHDIFITNRPSFASQCQTTPGLGDHHAISIHSSAQAHGASLHADKFTYGDMHADIDNFKQDARSFTTSLTQTFTIDGSIHTFLPFLVPRTSDNLVTSVHG